MLLVLANVGDPRGPLLCSRWHPQDARLLTPADLGQPGWCVDCEDPQASRAVVGGEILEAAEIEGVCSLMPCVLESDVTHVRASDRPFVAAEMTAFLCAWLTALSCPVVNSPGPACLCGPAWPPERWLALAAAAGLPALPARVPALPPTTEATVALTITVVNGSAFGPAADDAEALALTLAAHVGVALLRVHLIRDPALVVTGADLWIEPDVGDAADAIRTLLLGGT